RRGRGRARQQPVGESLLGGGVFEQHRLDVQLPPGGQPGRGPSLYLYKLQPRDRAVREGLSLFGDLRRQLRRPKSRNDSFDNERHASPAERSIWHLKSL